MIAYLDTSAIVPLLVSEPSTPRCRTVWESADDVVASLLSLVETEAALAQAERMGRLTTVNRQSASASFSHLWESVTVVTPDERIVRVAAVIAREHALRGYDAVHCATALATASDDTVAVAGDQDLLRAWRDRGLATIDVNG